MHWLTPAATSNNSILDSSRAGTLVPSSRVIASGLLTSDAKMYPLLGVTPFGGVPGDARLGDITIQELLDHTAGWDQNIEPVFDPVFKTVQISTQLALDHPANASDVIRWMFAKPLQHAPGTSNVYSNLGYQVLGRVIEKVTGQSYTDYLRSQVLGPFGITNIIQSHSRPPERDPAGDLVRG